VLDVTIPEEFSSAGILNLLTKFDVKGSRVTLIRGSRSDNTLPTRLESQGANVDSVKVYRTSLTDSERMTDLIEMITLGGVDIILFSSPSTVRSFLDSVSRQDLDLGILDKIVVAAIGPVTGNYLRDSGVQVTVESNTFEIGGLLESITRYLDGNAKAK
jgi:uroporphyrinogen III methyltransferase/synthase